MEKLSHSYEQPKKRETAYDLTEEERKNFRASCKRLLTKRAIRVIDEPDPNRKYFNEKGEVYIPEPETYFVVEIQSDELEPFGLAYDKISITSDKENSDDGIVAFQTERMIVDEIPVKEGKSVKGIGIQGQYVVLAKDPQLGIVIEDEDGYKELRTMDDFRETFHDAEGKPVELVGAPSGILDGPKLTRDELVNFTTILNEIYLNS